MPICTRILKKGRVKFQVIKHKCIYNLQAHDTSVRCMVWSHNDQWMLTADHGGFVKYWQSNMNNVKMYQAHKEAIRGLRLGLVATSCGDMSHRTITSILLCLHTMSMTALCNILLLLYAVYINILLMLCIICVIQILSIVVLKLMNHSSEPISDYDCLLHILNISHDIKMFACEIFDEMLNKLAMCRIFLCLFNNVVLILVNKDHGAGKMFPNKGKCPSTEFSIFTHVILKNIFCRNKIDAMINKMNKERPSALCV